MRLAIFIDGSNFYASLRRFDSDVVIDYDKLAVWIAQRTAGQGHVTLVGVHYFYGVGTNTFDTTNKFLDGLETRAGYFVHRTRRVQRHGECQRCGNRYHYNIEKQNDVALTVTMLQMAAGSRFDACVLLSGDEDFVPVIQAINGFGQQTWIATWGAELSDALRRVAYGHMNLRQSLSFVTKHRREGRRSSMTETMAYQVDEKNYHQACVPDGEGGVQVALEGDEASEACAGCEGPLNEAAATADDEEAAC
jgi:uncharacterized LabA/DUF88 family protein